MIGGGVAGMEAARILKIRKYDVEIFEKSEYLGGHVIPASKPKFKADLYYLSEWYENEMKRLDIKINFNKEFKIEDIKENKFDVYIVATGSESINLTIKGISKNNVANSIEVLNEEKKLDGRICIIGGGVEGCETAVWLSSKGRDVFIVEKLDTIARGIHRANRAMLLDMLKEKNIPVYTSSTTIEVNKEELKILNKNGNIINEKVDSIIFAVGMKSTNKLYLDLLEKGKTTFLIGDGFKPGKIADAIWQATMLCTEL
ncbi:MAG: NAD(P)/FAD-dependent oxidoreductase [Spirochaetales bacterium]|nr:NAD(P)/FAD-dependent oxidoreductase [Spirochaetales bacterium]